MPPIATILRRFALWLVICAVSAAPSFLIAAGADFDKAAMVLGVLVFALAYTAVTCTPPFARFHARPFVRRTLYIGYGVRLILSFAWPFGWYADLFPGAMSISAVRALGLEPEYFAGTFATTLVQGTILNAILAVFMSVVYVIQRLTMKPPPAYAPRGFAVVQPVAPQAAVPVVPVVRSPGIPGEG